MTQQLTKEKPTDELLEELRHLMGEQRRMLDERLVEWEALGREEGRRMSETPVPNRLVETPKELYELLEHVASNPNASLTDYQRLIRLAYSRGYHDGYRDGHTDAENGHDERVMVNLA